MIVVSDTSPIVALIDVEQLDLLRLLYGAVIIPRGVLEELRVGRITVPAWIEVKDVQDRDQVSELEQKLDSGEAEALALAVQIHADLVLIDERRGRSVANELGLRTTGVLGVLVRAKHQGHIEAVAPLLDELIEAAGFFVSKRLRAEALALAGESADD